MEELFLESGDHVHLEIATIPKATFLRLRALDNEYLRWSNQKAVLEVAIKQYGTLTLDSTILLHFGGKTHRFLVVGLEPAPHANLIDTDVTLELEGDPDAELFGASLEATEIETKNEKKEEPEEESPQITKPSSQSNDGANPAKRRKRRKRGEEIEEDDEKDQKSFQAFGGVGHKMGNVAPNTTTNSIQSSSSTTAKKPAETGNKLNAAPQQQSADETPPPNSVLCKNCKKYVPDYSFARHEAFCHRNNFCCPICDQVMPKSQELTHHDEVHKEVKCPDCQKEMEPSLIPDHLENICEYRKLRCTFCSLNFDAKEIFEHSNLCGSRTEECPKCKKYVLLREFDYHTSNNCAFIADIVSFDDDYKPTTNPFATNDDLTNSNVIDEDLDFTHLTPVTENPVTNSAQDETFSALDRANVDDLQFCPFCFAPFTEYTELLNHMTGQLDELFVLIKSNKKVNTEALESIVNHLGSLTDTEDIHQIIKESLNTEDDYVSKLIELDRLKPVIKISDDKELIIINEIIKEDKHKILQNLLKLQSVNPNQLDENKNTPLHIACNLACINSIKILLQSKRASLTLRNNEKKSPIFSFLDNSLLSTDKKCEILTCFFEFSNIPYPIQGKYLTCVKAALSGIFRNIYLDEFYFPDDNEIDFLNRVQQFLAREPVSAIKKIQSAITAKIRKIKNHSNNQICAELRENKNANTLQNGTLSVNILNTGTVPFTCEIIFPNQTDFSKCSCSHLSGKLVTIQVNDSFETIIQNLPAEKACIVVKCKPAEDKSAVGPFYVFVPFIPVIEVDE